MFFQRPNYKLGAAVSAIDPVVATAGLAIVGQRGGALNLLDDFTEDIADTEKDKGADTGLSLISWTT